MAPSPAQYVCLDMEVACLYMQIKEAVQLFADNCLKIVTVVKTCHFQRVGRELAGGCYCFS